MGYFEKIANFVHILIFKQEMSPDFRGLLRNVIYFALGNIPSLLLNFIVNVSAARLLGPFEYGQFTLVQAISIFLCMSMLPGYDNALIKYVSEKDIFEYQSKIISISYIIVTVLSTVSVLIYLCFANLLSKFFSVSNFIIILSIFFAVSFAFFTLSMSTLRGIYKMKNLGILQILFSVILICVFGLFMSQKIYSSISIVFSFIFAYLAISLIILITTSRHYFHKVFDTLCATKLTKYSFFCLIGGVASAICGNFDKLVINYYMSLKDVGQYGVYCITAFSAISILYSTFLTVFFPFASKYQNKGAIFSKVNLLIPYFIIFSIPFIVISQFIMLQFYGNQYPFILGLSILFGIAGICICVNGIYAWLMASVGSVGIKITTISAIASALSCVGLNLILIPAYSFYGAVLSFIISYLISFGIIISQKHYFNDGSIELPSIS